MRRWWLCVLALALGCATSAEDAPPAPSKARPTAAPRIVDVEVRWPAASAIDQAVLAKLSDDARAVVRRAPVPVLVVDEGDMAASATLMAEKRWFALSTRGDSVIVSVHASKAAHRYPGMETAGRGRHRVRGHDAWVTQNEAIWSAAWIENGVAYSLELECAALPDPRCDSEDYLMQLAGKLAFVGGEGVR